MHSVTVQLRLSELLPAIFRVLLRLRIFRIMFVAMLLTCAWQTRGSFARDGVFGFIAVPLTALLFTAAAIVLVFLMQSVIVFVRARRQPAFLGPREYVVEAEGLRVRADALVHVAPPGRIERLVRTRRVLYVGLSSRALHILPRRCFASAAAYEEFWNALQPLVAKPEKQILPA